MSFELSSSERSFLLGFARKSIEHFLRTGKKLPVPTDVSPNLSRKCGVFVTLNIVTETGSKELRGCIGYPEAIYPLVEAVRDSAISSAVGDPRFPPLSIRELEDIVIEISILTPPQLIEVKDPLDYPSEIKVGRDGLIIERGWRRGLLLPQVAVEWKWDEEDFLSQCCVKAGLPPDAWLLPGTKVYKFQALVFEEGQTKEA